MGNDTQRLGDMVVENIKRFRAANEAYGYRTEQVNAFFDSLVESVELFEGMNSGGNENLRAVCDKAIRTINSSRFVQGFKGYDVFEVDSFLDDTVKLIKLHRDNESITEPIDVNLVNNAKFSMSFRGYDLRGVDEFLEVIAKDLESINRAK